MIGALLGGVVADLFDLPAAVLVVAALSVASGLVVAARMTETASGTSPPSSRLAGI